MSERKPFFRNNNGADRGRRGDLKRKRRQQIKLAGPIAQIPQQGQPPSHQIVKLQEMHTAGYVKIVQLVTRQPASAVICTRLSKRGLQGRLQWIVTRANALFYYLYTQFSLLFVGIRSKRLAINSPCICIDGSHPGKQLFLPPVSIAQNFQINKPLIRHEIVASKPAQLRIQ